MLRLARQIKLTSMEIGMNSSIHRGAALLALLLGAVHIALTPLYYSTLSVPALWFVGSGLALLLIASHNLMLHRAPGDRVAWRLTVLANVGGFAFAALLVWVQLQPQTLLVGTVTLLLLATSVRGHPSHLPASRSSP
jgi:hypothetical protein